MELFEEDDDDGVCKEATTEFIDWLASKIWRFSLDKIKNREVIDLVYKRTYFVDFETKSIKRETKK